MRILTLAVLAAALLPLAISAAPKSTSKAMSFEDCLTVVRNTATQLGVAPINVVETRDMRMVRFVTTTGSVLITCSRPDRSMVVTVSER